MKSNIIYDLLNKVIPSYIDNEDVIFFCIGTDRSTGDCLAPLVGTKLKELGYTNVIGTLENPVHALNLEENISQLSNDKFIIAIDACLGRIENIGKIQVTKEGITAGSGLGKSLPKVGDYGIIGIVNQKIEGQPSLNHLILQNTKLSLVMKMVDETIKGIIERFPLHKNKKKHQTLIEFEAFSL